jgi:hypothetical protein
MYTRTRGMTVAEYVTYEVRQLVLTDDYVAVYAEESPGGGLHLVSRPVQKVYANVHKRVGR